VSINTNQKPSWTQAIINVSAFAGVHLVCLAAFWTGVTKVALVLFVASFLLRKFGITAGYHRYFSHRTFKTNRVGQFALAWLACSAAQKGPLWWAGHHRSHQPVFGRTRGHAFPLAQGSLVRAHGLDFRHQIRRNQFEDYSRLCPISRTSLAQ
jgi:fatty-acid desaturase